MKKIKYIFIVVMLLFFPTFVFAKNPVNIYVFYGQGCPHCEDLFTFLDELKGDNDYKEKFEVIKYETWYDTSNNDLMYDVATYFDTSASGVPFYIIGDYYSIGFPSLSSTDSSIQERVTEIENKIKENINEKYENQSEDIVSQIKEGKIKVTTTIKTTTKETNEQEDNENNSSNENTSYKMTDFKWIMIGVIIAIGLVISFFVIKWVVKD